METEKIDAKISRVEKAGVLIMKAVLFGMLLHLLYFVLGFAPAIAERFFPNVHFYFPDVYYYFFDSVLMPCLLYAAILGAVVSAAFLFRRKSIGFSVSIFLVCIAYLFFIVA